MLEGLHNGRNAQAYIAVAVKRPHRHRHDDTANEWPQRRVGHMPLHEAADCVGAVGEDHADQAEQNAGKHHAQNTYQAQGSNLQHRVMRVVHT
ncbi:hypothetical protein D3C72_1884900 [compost metagenome]